MTSHRVGTHFKLALTVALSLGHLLAPSLNIHIGDFDHAQLFRAVTDSFIQHPSTFIIYDTPSTVASPLGSHRAIEAHIHIGPSLSLFSTDMLMPLQFLCTLGFFRMWHLCDNVLYVLAFKFLTKLCF